MINKFTLAALLASTSTVVLTTTPAFAQDEDTRTIVDTIVVTQKREQGAQTVPISVTAMNSDMVEAAAITNIDGIVNLVPGLNSRSDGPTQTVFAVRGIGTNAFGVGVDASVGVFVDDVYLGHPVLANTSFFDVERIEVVKGPQGTLFGRNTSAGAISVISKKAEFDENYLQVKLAGGDHGQRLVQGVANFATGENGALRLGAKSEVRNGSFKNLTSRNQLNNKKNMIFRASLNQDFTENVNFNLMTEFMKDDSRWGVQFIDNDNRRNVESEVYQGAREEQDVDSFRTALTINADLSDNLTLTSISSYTKVTSVTTPGDFDVLALDGDFEPTFMAGPDDLLIDLLPFREPGEFEFFSTELRLNGSTDSSDWFVGASFRKDKLSNDTSLVGMNNDHVGLLLAGDTCENVIGPDPICSTTAEEHSPANVDVTSWGVYGDYTYNFDDGLQLTVGGRYSQDKKTMDLVVTPNDGLFGVATGGEALVKIVTGEANASDTWSDFSPRVALSYNINDDAMLYGSYSKGFKSGGFNSALFDDGAGNVRSLRVEPETNNAYEIGIKSDLFDGIGRLNVAVFLSNYKNFQAEVQRGVSFSIQNVADAKIKGLEIESTFLPTDQSKIVFSYTHLDTEVISGEINGVNIAGNNLPFAPKHSLNAIAEYYFDANVGEVTLQAAYSYTSKQWATILGNSSAYLYSDAHRSLDLRISLDSYDKDWSVALLAQNILGERHWKSSTDVIGGLFGAEVPVGLPNYDKSFRAEVTYKF